MCSGRRPASVPPLAIVPVNRLEKAKGRLGGVLSAVERRELALITMRTVVEAVAQCGVEPAVLTADEAVAKAARAAGARVIAEDAGAHGLNGQLERALDGAPDVLVLHADLPLASARSLARFVGPVGENSVLLLRSGDGGTNAMRIRPAGRFRLAYGAGSCALHRAAAQSAGMTVSVRRGGPLALDLDTPADIRTLLATGRGRQSAAGKYLLEHGVAARLAGHSAAPG